MKNDEYFMEIALQEAYQAFNEDEIPVGCVLVCEDKVVIKAHNSKNKDNDLFGHAEINALKQLQKLNKNWRMNSYTMYVTLEPCPMCASALQQARINRIVFGAYDKKGGACGGLFDLFMNPGLNYYPFIHGGVKQEECSFVLKEYFAKKRQK